MTVRLWLVRHGDTEWSDSGRLNGWRDVPLNAAGWRQAMALRSVLAGRRFASVRSSDLSRALSTARIAAGIAVPDSRLRELDFGALEGATWDRVPAATQRALLSFDDFAAPEGESVPHLRRRVREAIDELPDGDHLVVSHGGVIRLLLRDAGQDQRVEPGGVRTVWYRGLGR
jgi:probable phosphoglycerate mutase